MSRKLRKCLVSMIRNCVICRLGNWRQREISFSQSQAKQLFRHPIRLRDLRNFLEYSRKFHGLGDIKRRNQHVVTLPNFSHQPSGSEVLRLSPRWKNRKFQPFSPKCLTSKRFKTWKRSLKRKPSLFKQRSLSWWVWSSIHFTPTRKFSCEKLSPTLRM